MDLIVMHPRGADLAGLIPFMLDEDDPRPAREQLHENYAHGGGWYPYKGFTLTREGMILDHPEDPPLSPFAMMKLRHEEIWLYPHAWVLVFDSTDGTHEIARMD